MQPTINLICALLYLEMQRERNRKPLPFPLWIPIVIHLCLIVKLSPQVQLIHLIHGFPFFFEVLRLVS